MAKHWIYVLRCTDDFIYVGETKRLYRRLFEHLRHAGGQNTRTHSPLELIGLYRLDNNKDDAILNAHTCAHHEFENFVTEMLMLYSPTTWFKVRGGRYTVIHDLDFRFVRDHVSRQSEARQKEMEKRPFCHCGLPCEKTKNPYHNYNVYKCSLHNVWPKMITFMKRMYPDFKIRRHPCDYYYKEIPVEHENYEFNKRTISVSRAFEKIERIEEQKSEDKQ